MREAARAAFFLCLQVGPAFFDMRALIPSFVEGRAQAQIDDRWRMSAGKGSAAALQPTSS
jgi:hypothetical protein